MSMLKRTLQVPRSVLNSERDVESVEKTLDYGGIICIFFFNLLLSNDKNVVFSGKKSFMSIFILSTKAAEMSGVCRCVWNLLCLYPNTRWSHFPHVTLWLFEV